MSKFYGFGKEENNCPFKDDVKRYLNKRLFPSSNKYSCILNTEWEFGIEQIIGEFCDEK